jgi:hypothetical protein
MDVYDRYPAHLLCHIYVHLSCRPMTTRTNITRDAEDPNFPNDCSADAEHYPRCLP